MKKLVKPVKHVADILNILKMETTRKAVLLDIDSLFGVLNEREKLYGKKVQDNTLFEVQREQSITARVNNTKMISYYEYRILEKPKGRLVYDELFLSVPQNICPYCTVRTVKTIDHFLPKSEYPSYAITPSNMVPSCRDCNIEKKISYPISSSDQTFHPYFDNVENENWIRAQLIENEPVSFQYVQINPIGWSATKFSRASCHLASYDINVLFSGEADRELRGMQTQLKNLQSRDRNLLQAHLLDTYYSCLNGHGRNDWKTLMYQELSSNDWFLDGCIGTNFFD